jgi:cysteinyl-tRNA synthetase
MDLKLYDTLTREKRVFKPLDPHNVRMYVCGPTVYDFAHIGNARPVIVFDVLFRLLQHLAKQGVWDDGRGETKVTYVRNITDVDDKINARAAEEYPGLPLNEAIRKVTETTDRQFHDDVAALGCLPPTVEPRATAHIAEMRSLIERLVKSGNAYVAADNVLFSVSSDPDYGQLSKRPLDEMIAGARVEVAPYKRDSMDFILWKPSKPGEPAWPSPAGIKTPGRPGWHIECSAMSWKYLGEVFDIHGGGIDLVFPHHENEIAQSRCAFHTPAMANYWMHNGFLQVEGEKMAKSAGNFVTIHELLKEWTGPVLKYAMLQTHYHRPINWTLTRLKSTREEIGDWVGSFHGSAAHHDFQRRKFRKIPPEPTQEIVDALSDDLNTPNVVSILRRQFSESVASGLTAEFFQNCEFIGLLNGDKIGLLEGQHVTGSNIRADRLSPAMPHVLRMRVGLANNFPEIVHEEQKELSKIGVGTKVGNDGFLELVPLQQSDAPDAVNIESLINMRNEARKAKKFAEADKIRKKLEEMGVELEDHKDKPTTWKFKKASS